MLPRAPGQGQSDRSSVVPHLHIGRDGQETVNYTGEEEGTPALSCHHNQVETRTMA